MAKQQHLHAGVVKREFLSELATSVGSAVGRLLDLAGSRKSAKIQVIPHESDVVPGEIVWEDWKVDPSVIEFSDGRLRIHGHDDLELWQGPFRPLPVEVVEKAKEDGRPLLFRAHPTASGLFFVEPAA